MFLTTGRRKMKDGSYYTYYVLKETYWDKAEKRQKQRYLAYVGVRRTISQEKAEKIAQKLGCSLDALKRVGIRIVPAKPKGEEKPESSLGGGSPPPPQRITESFPIAARIQLSRKIKPHSEQVLLDGQRLIRDYHYDIDYDTGLLRVIYLLYGRTITVEYGCAEVAPS